MLSGVAGLLGRDLHDLELGRIRGAPHGEGPAATLANDESASRDQVRMARAVSRPRIPALVELTGGKNLEVRHGEVDRPAAIGVTRSGQTRAGETWLGMKGNRYRRGGRGEQLRSKEDCAGDHRCGQ